MSRVLLCATDNGFDHYSVGSFYLDERAAEEWVDEPPYCPYLAGVCEHHCTAGARACVDGP